MNTETQMKPSVNFLPCFLALTAPLAAETVVITSVADEQHPIAPLTTLAGVALGEDTQIRIGAFPGLSDDALLDLASQGGLALVSATMVPFGDACMIGQGVDGAAGGFEISVRHPDPGACTGQTISLLIQSPPGEFIVARFSGRAFEAPTDTGLEPLDSLHLSDAKIIVGSRFGSGKLAASTAPAVGSFESWLAGFPSITDPLLKLPGADADADGWSNLLEYATGGNPAVAGGTPPCSILTDGEGGMWLRFKHVAGLGTIRYELQTSDALSTPWAASTLPVEAEPESPGFMRAHLASPLSANGFFRLSVESDD